MNILLSLLLISFVVNSILIIPFIKLLYTFKFTRRDQKTTDPLGKPAKFFDLLNLGKSGTPVGGGILLVLSQVFLFTLFLSWFKFHSLHITHLYPRRAEIFILIFTLISFALIGLYDDLLKFFNFKERQFFGLRFRTKLLIQLGVALFIGFWLYFKLGINFVFLGPLGVLYLGPFYILFATLFIVFFANAFNITDGLDGLASGLLLFNLISFWFISTAILDNILSIYLAIWIGSLLAFLYFNIYPARIMLGDVGALSFGAVLALIGLLLGKIIPIIFISGLFILEALSSLLQLTAKKFFHRRLFPIAPFHLLLRKRGWDEPKVVARAWLAQIVLAILGLFLAMSNL